MISRFQIVAARALLDWNQEKLAQSAGITKDMVSKIEGGKSDGSLKTLRQIEQALNIAGIVFTDNDGVKRNSYNIQVYQGVDGFNKFYDELYEVAKTQGGEFCVNNVNENLFDRWHHSPERLQHHLDRMAEVVRNNPAFRMRIIIEQGDKNFRATKYAQYRWAGKEQFSDISFYVYGDRLAILIFEDNDVYITVVPNRRVADAYRKQFNLAWETAHEPDAAA